jgi:ribonuclease G
MSGEILINVGPRETRAALLENGVLQEVFIERASRRGLVGNIYKGRVSRVLPGMQAAFVEAGLERAAFLHVDDIGGGAAAAGASGNGGGDAPAAKADPAAAPAPTADIRKLVTEGDDIVVQIVKDPIGGKGARLTTYISLPSRYLVFMPRGQGIGVSARIESEEERERLRGALATIVREGHPGGYILRTAAQGATAEQLAADLAYLERLWTHVRERSVYVNAGDLVHEDLPLALRVLRDELSPAIERVLVDDSGEHARLRQFAHDFIPRAETRIDLYAGARPIFDLHAVEEEIQRALDRKVSLKSGGYLVIDQTESMTTIDVNTGGFVGYRNLEDTIFRTNLEAAVTIARQLRLRNLGGIIIIDFIDMEDEAHRRQLLEALQRSVAADRAQTHVANLSPLGLVEMTRKRTRESLEHLLCEACPTCEARGFVASIETVCQQIFRDILRQARQARQFGSRELLVLAHQRVVDNLLGEDSSVLAELETEVGRPIRLQSEALYEVDQFDVVLM